MDNQQYDKITKLKGIYDDIVENHLSKVTPRGIIMYHLRKT